MIKFSEYTREEKRVFWLKNAQSWLEASGFWLGHDEPIEALHCFVRGLIRITWARAERGRTSALLFHARRVRERRAPERVLQRVPARTVYAPQARVRRAWQQDEGRAVGRSTVRPRVLIHQANLSGLQNQRPTHRQGRALVFRSRDSHTKGVSQCNSRLGSFPSTAAASHEASASSWRDIRRPLSVVDAPDDSDAGTLAVMAVMLGLK